MKTWLAAAAVLLLLVGGGVGFVHWRARATIAAFEDETRSRETPPRSAGRPPLGDPLEGLAEEEYRRLKVPAPHELEPGELDLLRRALRMPFGPLADPDLGQRLAKAASQVDGAALQAVFEDRYADALDLDVLARGVEQDAARLGEWTAGPVASLMALESRSLSLEQLRGAARRLDAAERHAAPALWAGRRLVEFRQEAFRLVMSTDPDRLGWRALWSPTIVRARILAAFERYDEAYRAAAEGPSAGRRQRIDAVPNVVESVRNPDFRHLEGMYWRMTAGAQVSLGFFASFHDSRPVQRAALAVAWYEAEHGRFPGTLAELVPAYLPRVPEVDDLRYADGVLHAGKMDLRVRSKP